MENWAIVSAVDGGLISLRKTMPDPAKPDEKMRPRQRQRGPRYKGASGWPLSGCTPYALALLAILVLLIAVATPG